MPARTVKGPQFAIVVDGKRIIVKHVYAAKGKRCRVIVPEGVLIEGSLDVDESPADSFSDDEE
jgi:hypothetical protein